MTGENPPSERERLVLPDECRTRDTFSQWLTENYDRVHGAAARVARLLLRAADADDAVQESMVALYRAVVIRGVEILDVERWVVAVTARRATSIWRDCLPEQPSPAADIGRQVGRLAADVPWENTRYPDWDLLRQALATMTPAEGLCFFLHHVEGWTLAEIAETYSTTTDTIKTQLFRARAKAQRLFGEGET